MAHNNNSNRGKPKKPNGAKSASDTKPAASGASADKKPKVTLDLKAKEVSVETPATAKSASASKTDADKSKSSSGTRPTASAASSSAPKTATSSSTSSTASASSTPPSKSSSTTSAPASGSKSASGSSSSAGGGGKTPPPPGGSGRAAQADGSGSGGGFLSHLAASLVGGVVALGGGWMLGGGSETPGTEPVQATRLSGEAAEQLKALEAKLASLQKATSENAAKPAASAELPKQVTDQLKGLADRVQKVEALDSTVSQLAKAQQNVLAKSTELQQKLTDGTTDVEQVATLKRRLASMESTLDSLAKAAENQGASTIPQLASLTGRINDINNAIDEKLAALKKSLNADIQAQTASMSARIDTQLKANEEIATLQAGNKRIGTDVETLKETASGLEKKIAGVSENVAELAKRNETFSKSFAELEKSLAATAKPDDIKSAIAPVTTQVAAISKNVSGLMEREQNRTAKANNIILALELDNLKKAIDRGEDISADFDRVKAMAGDTVDLAPLEALKNTQVPTVAALQRAFNDVAVDAIRAANPPEEGGIFDRLVNNATSLVKVRRTGDVAGDGPDAVVARMEQALKSGKLTEVVDEAKALPDASKAAFKPWLEKVQARATLNEAVAKINNDLRKAVAPATAN